MNIALPIILALTAATLTTTGIAINEHHAARLSTTQVRTLEHDTATWKREAASKDNHARTLQRQLDAMKVDLDAKTSLLRVLNSHND